MQRKFLVWIIILSFGLLLTLFGKYEINKKNLDFETKTSEGSVTIDLTPKNFDGNNFYVDVGLNTHTLDLSNFDLNTNSKSEFFLTVSFDSSHNATITINNVSGTLVFVVNEMPKNFAIAINGIPDLPIRRFEW